MSGKGILGRSIVGNFNGFLKKPVILSQILLKKSNIPWNLSLAFFFKLSKPLTNLSFTFPANSDAPFFHSPTVFFIFSFVSFAQFTAPSFNSPKPLPILLTAPETTPLILSQSFTTPYTIKPTATNAATTNAIGPNKDVKDIPKNVIPPAPAVAEAPVATALAPNIAILPVRNAKPNDIWPNIVSIGANIDNKPPTATTTVTMVGSKLDIAFAISPMKFTILSICGSNASATLAPNILPIPFICAFIVSILSLNSFDLSKTPWSNITPYSFACSVNFLRSSAPPSMSGFNSWADLPNSFIATASLSASFLIPPRAVITS